MKLFRGFPIRTITWEDWGAENKAVRRGWNPTPDLAATSRKGDALAYAQVTAPDPTSVYRYYDAADMLIYVGITRQGMGRNVQHNGKAEWWPYVTRQEVEHCATRGEAMAREKELIRCFRPPFNKQHNSDHAATRAAYLAFVAGPEKRESAPGLYARLKKRLPLEIVSFEAGQLTLRSHLDHAPLASAIRAQKEIVPIRSNRKLGTLLGIRHAGPFVLFTCHLRKATEPDFVESASASLGWSQNTKPQFPWIRQIVVNEGGNRG